MKHFQVYYVNVFTGVAWYTARDKLGRVYYYEENGNESCWTLPSVAQTIQDHSAAPSPAPALARPALWCRNTLHIHRLTSRPVNKVFIQYHQRHLTG